MISGLAIPSGLNAAIGPVSFPLGLPVLAGGPDETIFADAVAAGQSGSFVLAETADWLIGAALGGEDEDPETAAHRLYQELFNAARGRALARIWNYVPAINEPNAQGLENYRAFCRGRSQMFENAFGQSFAEGLPSASAVGTSGDRLVIIFAASRHEPKHFENPLQVAAYDYPPEHGPRSPSFARATRAGADVFVSGTAAVRGHASVAPGNSAAQLDCTLENLSAIGRECGLGADLGAGRARARYWKIYLRHTLDLAAVKSRMDEWMRPEDHVHYVLSDICRAELNVEIEVSVMGLRD